MADKLEQEVKCGIRAVLLSAQSGLTCRDLQRDFQQMMGYKLPYQQLGHSTLITFLQSIPDTLIPVTLPTGDIILKAVADQTTKHVQKLVSKQKSSNSCNKETRDLLKRQPKYVQKKLEQYIPQIHSKQSAMAVPRTVSANQPRTVSASQQQKRTQQQNKKVSLSVQRQIASVLQDYPEGIAMGMLNEVFQIRTGSSLLPYDDHSITLQELLLTLPHLLKVKNCGSKLKVFLHDQLVKKVERQESREQSQVEGGQTFSESSYSQNNLPVAELCNTASADHTNKSNQHATLEPESEHGPSASVRVPGSESSVSSAGYLTAEEQQGAADAEIDSCCRKGSDEHLTSIGVSEERQTAEADEGDEGGRYGQEDCNYDSYSNSAGDGENDVDSSSLEREEDVDKSENEDCTVVSDLVSDMLKENFQKILAKFPGGLWCSQLRSEYKHMFGVELNSTEYGCISMVELVTQLTDVFRCLRPHCQSDWILFDARKEVPETYSLLRESMSPLGFSLQDNIGQQYTQEVIEDTTFKVSSLLQSQPNGIPLHSFQQHYTGETGEELKVDRLGFPGLESFLISLADTVLEMQATQDGIMIYPRSGQHDILENTVHESSHRVTADREPETQCRIDVADKEFILPFKTDVADEEFIPTLRADVAGPEFVLPVQDLPPHTRPQSYLDLIVAEVFTPHKFWVQLRGKETHKALDKIMDKLESFFGDEEKRMEYQFPAPALAIGQLCASSYKDEMWHRAKITGFKDKHSVEVFYIDYGTVYKTTVESLCLLPQQFCHLPAQAIRARLSRIKPGGEAKRWIRPASQRFLQLVEEKEGLVALVEEVDREQHELSVILCDTSTENDVYINDVLVAEDYAEFDLPEEARQGVEHSTPDSKAANMLGGTADNVANIQPSAAVNIPTVPPESLPSAASDSLLGSIAADGVCHPEVLAAALQQQQNLWHYLQGGWSGNLNGTDTGVDPNLLVSSILCNQLMLNLFMCNSWPQLGMPNAAVGNPEVAGSPVDSGIASLASGDAASQLNSLFGPAAAEAGEASNTGAVLMSEQEPQSEDTSEDPSLIQAMCDELDEAVGLEDPHFVKPVDLTCEFKSHIVNLKDTPYLTSAEVSLFFPSWKGQDRLKRMLEMKHISVPDFVVQMTDAPDLFSEMQMFCVPGYENPENGHLAQSVTLYPLKVIPQILQMFSHRDKELHQALQRELQLFDPNDKYWS